MAAAPRNLVADVRRFFEEHRPCSCCDACLALNFGLTLERARALALTLADSPGFIRERHTCDACDRLVEVTSTGRQRRQPRT